MFQMGLRIMQLLMVLCWFLAVFGRNITLYCIFWKRKIKQKTNLFFMMFFMRVLECVLEWTRTAA